MRNLLLFGLVLLGVVASAGLVDDGCQYDAAANTCAPTLHAGVCGYWNCMMFQVKNNCNCSGSIISMLEETMLMECHLDGANTQLHPQDPSFVGPASRDGSDFSAATSLQPKLQGQKEGGEQDAEGMPVAKAQCWADSHKWTRAEVKHKLHHVAMVVYRDRNKEHYTEGDKRWSGIQHNVCPPHAPPYSDCSSTVTWIYWTVFGKGKDFLNGEDWKAGYTGTLDKHGTRVGIKVDDLQVGDLCFYYHPMHHVAIYVGGGKVVSHGADPVGYYPVHYAPTDFCIRYI
jgi:cell wall-associated NlpC family hydrolase